MNYTLLYIIGGYILVIAIIYLIQESFIFKPEKLKQDFIYKYDVPFEELFFDVEPGVRINGLHFNVKNPLGLGLIFSWQQPQHKRLGKICKGFLSAIIMM